MPLRNQAFLAALAACIALGAISPAHAEISSDLACLFVNSGRLEPVIEGTLVEPGTSDLDRALFVELQAQARGRIELAFGAPRARPIVVFFRDANTFGPLTLNNFGSAGAFGNRSCVFIGPQGQNIDVIAHELMHAELHDRIGSWRMFREIPTWFDEGVAMQVDFRPQYSLPKEQDIESETAVVREFRSPGQFNHGGSAQVSRNYTFAKAELARWLAEVGGDGLYQRFERIRAGEKFNAVLVK